MSRSVHRKEGRSTNILLNRFIMCGERRQWTFSHSDQNCILETCVLGEKGKEGWKEGGREGGREGERKRGREEGREGGRREGGRVRKEGGREGGRKRICTGKHMLCVRVHVCRAVRVYRIAGIFRGITFS